MTFGELRRKCRQSFGVAALGAVLLVAFAASVRYVAGPVLQKTPVVTFYPAIAIATYMGDRRAGWVAAAASALSAWYLFIEPPFSFVAADLQELYGVIAFGLASLLTVEIIAWINRTQDRLEAAARENEILFLELKHRIANNLQTVASLLTLHRTEIPDGPARRIIGEAIDRIRVIGDVHRNIYQPTADRIDAARFLTRFCKDIGASLATKSIECRINAAACWKPETMVPLALMLHELVSNALEHGIFGQDDGRVIVTLQTSAPGRTVLSVEDNGRGMAAGFDPETSKRLGLKLVRLFAEQIDATVAWTKRSGGGTRVVLEFASDMREDGAADRLADVPAPNGL